ncbi:hypothetical protein PUN28_006021 [Cardiocondyla obscurior]|uniref:Uncharacterized protein n=1 Tax=Cardiocondyla obscurior TaxID=286306 RepID=A0AAW2G8P0_9HYME
MTVKLFNTVVLKTPVQNLTISNLYVGLEMNITEIKIHKYISSDIDNEFISRPVLSHRILHFRFSSVVRDNFIPSSISALSLFSLSLSSFLLSSLFEEEEKGEEITITETAKQIEKRTKRRDGVLVYTHTSISSVNVHDFTSDSTIL